MIHEEIKSAKNGISSKKRGKSLKKSFSHLLDIQNIYSGEHLHITHSGVSASTLLYSKDVLS